MLQTTPLCVIDVFHLRSLFWIAASSTPHKGLWIDIRGGCGVIRWLRQQKKLGNIKSNPTGSDHGDPFSDRASVFQDCDSVIADLSMQ